MYDGDTGRQITKQTLINALNRLGDLLKAKNKRLELVCCGGIVSVLYLSSRQMTHDVDVIFPIDPSSAKILTSLVDEVGAELSLEHGPQDKWFNDSVRFFGLKSKSNTIVFNHSHLVLKAADWHEMLAHKISAFRGKRDINDAVHFLKEIRSKNKVEVFKKVSSFRPFTPCIADKVFETRFNQIWDSIYGRS